MSGGKSDLAAWGCGRRPDRWRWPVRTLRPPCFMTKAITAFILAMAFLIPSWAAEMSLEELRAEYRKRFSEAAQSPGAGEWAKVEEWIESRQAAAPQGEPWGSVFREWKDRVAVEVVRAELKALAPDDRAGLLALADQHAKGRPGEDQLREALAAYVKSHPLDDGVYQRCLAGLEGTARFQAHFARSDGWMALAEKEKRADQFYQAGQWHETLPEAECNQTPVRVIQCYLKAMRLAPDEPKYREALDQWLKRIIPAPIHPAEIGRAPANGQRLTLPADHRPSPKPVANNPTEDEARNGKRFKVESEGKCSYWAEPPLSKDGIDGVWELGGDRESAEAHREDDRRDHGEVRSVVEKPEQWIPLQWDEEVGEWVVHPRAAERQRLKEMLAQVEKEIRKFKESIPVLESKAKQMVEPENLVERAGREIDAEATVQEVRAFYLGLIAERREERQALDTLVTYRASLPLFENRAKQLRAELAAVERRGRQRTVSLTARLSSRLPFPPWFLLAGAVAVVGLVGVGYWRKKKGGKFVAKKAKAKAAPVKKKPPAPAPVAIDKAVPSKA